MQNRGIKQKLIVLALGFSGERSDFIAVYTALGFALGTVKAVWDAKVQAERQGVSIERVFEKYKEQKRSHYRQNRERLLPLANQYAKENKDARLAYAKERAQKPEQKEKKRQYKRERWKTDPLYKAEGLIRHHNMRVRALIGGKKTNRTLEEVGYSAEEYYNHMLATLPEGFDYNDCHHDHIIPISFLVSVGITELRIVNSLDNLQLLSPAENQFKHAKVDLSRAKGVVREALVEKGFVC